MRLSEIGCEITVADLQNSGSLARAIGDAEAVQVIFPLRLQTKDPIADLLHSAESTIKALRLSNPKRVLAISDYGAHVTEDIGMPSIFHRIEAQLRELQGHRVILRSAEHMHNWGRIISPALGSGIMPSFQDPIEMAQPTISAQDLGQISAMLLLRPDTGKEVEIIHAEGPRRYSAGDVAAALSQLSGHTIRAQAVPRSQWNKALDQLPESLAAVLIKTNDAKNKGGLVEAEPNAGEVIYSATSLIDALRPLLPS